MARSRPLDKSRPMAARDAMMTLSMRRRPVLAKFSRVISLIAWLLMACWFGSSQAVAAWPRRAVTDEPAAWPRFQSFPADADELHQADEPTFGSGSAGSLPLDEPSAGDGQPQTDGSLAPPPRIIGDAAAAPQYGLAPQHAPPPSDAPAQYGPPLPLCPEDPVPPQSRLWRLLPEGMIPYIGPRTPDSRKDLGIGDPLVGRTWRAQPFSLSGFSGATNGGPLIRGHVFERPSYYGGMNFGWDYDHYWGIEKRLGFGALNLTNSRGQRLQTGLSVTGEYRIMYYPLGDARWRPFFTTGIGWSDFYFQDDHNHHHLDTLFLFPFGVGVKYLCAERWALRIDLIDELTIGGGPVSTFHYVALTAGLEFRYGQRLLRMPWHRPNGS
jgi:hypothetical protein